MKIVMAKTATDLLRSGNGTFCVSESSRDSSAALPHSCAADTAMHAAREAVHLLAKRTHATGGLILMDCEGNPGFAFNTPRMAYGYVAANGSLITAV
jgi:isoaspartyl peptidase/L-asparaginase-like protein (Ntn-hydrolase superfamily)